MREFSNMRLTRHNWRKIEQPTLAIRMRALCNDLKASLLAAANDPHSPQTTAVLNTGSSPVKDEATWHGWWHGGRMPQSAPLRSCEDLVPGISRWLDLSEFGNPVQRHMLALDAVGIELARKESEWKELKFRAQERSLASLRRVWSIFTSTLTEEDNAPLHFSNQIKFFDQTLPPPSLRYATIQSLIGIDTMGVNPYLYEFDGKVSDDFRASAKFSIFKILLHIYTSGALNTPWLTDILIIDIATMTALIRAELITDTPDLPEHNVLPVFRFFNKIFWQNKKDFSRRIETFPDHVKSIEDSRATTSVSFIRHRYYEILSHFGIRFVDVHKIMNPGPVVLDSDPDYSGEAMQP